jgi:hypothetical protein
MKMPCIGVSSILYPLSRGECLTFYAYFLLMNDSVHNPEAGLPNKWAEELTALGYGEPLPYPSLAI